MDARVLRLALHDRVGRLAGADRHQVIRLLLLLRAGEGVARAGEKAVERVVVLRGNWIKLVIVVAGAAEAKAENRLAGGVDGVLNGQVVIVLRIEAEAARDG